MECSLARGVNPAACEHNNTTQHATTQSTKRSSSNKSLDLKMAKQIKLYLTTIYLPGWMN